MALLAHQKIQYVIPGKPFGRGTLGAYSSSTVPTMTKDSCSGTATSTTLTTTGSTFANGDLLKIIQMRGTGVGQWEIALVSSGGGSTSLTLSKALTYTYTDSGASQAQAIKINEYTDVTVGAGTWSAPAWDGNVGGVLVFAAKGTLTPTGTISGNTLGFRGNAGSTADDATPSNQGEGTGGAGTTAVAANGNGGGGAQKDGADEFGAAGGGNGAAGSDGGGGASAGDGGAATGDTNLQTITMGGAGGAADVYEGAGGAGSGGTGGAIITIYAKTVVAPTSITTTGSAGGASSCNAAKPSDRRRLGNAGGGAGGTILICAGTVDVGTDKLTTVGGAGATSTTNAAQSNVGGAGAKGRIAVYYGTSLAGTISASLYGSYTNEQDLTLKESVGGMFFMM